MRVSGGVQAGAGQLIEGWNEQSAEASARAGVGEVDGMRSGSSPAGIAGSLFSTLLPIMCARITLATALEMRAETLVGGVGE